MNSPAAQSPGTRPLRRWAREPPENWFVMLTGCTAPGTPSTTRPARASGGGLSNDGTLTLTNCTVSGNSSPGPTNSDGVAAGGGLYNQETATLTGCTISGTRP